MGCDARGWLLHEPLKWQPVNWPKDCYKSWVVPTKFPGRPETRVARFYRHVDLTDRLMRLGRSVFSLAPARGHNDSCTPLLLWQFGNENIRVTAVCHAWGHQAILVSWWVWVAKAKQLPLVTTQSKAFSTERKFIGSNHRRYPKLPKIPSFVNCSNLLMVNCTTEMPPG